MTDPAALDRFITRWRANEGGAERANFPLFLMELCTLLDLPQPDPADATHERNDYVFERAVEFRDEAGRAGHGRIDLYRKGAFVLEAKQSREKRGGLKEITLPATQAPLPGFAAPDTRGRRSANRGWDVLMRNAREQAEQYARALPTSHGWPPFIIVCDVGHAFEIFADFSGQGKNYRQFPDRGGFRIFLDELRDDAVRARLRAIWLDPHSLDPAKRAAEVTKDIAARLASVSKRLEDRGHAAEPVAHFLMRCLFTMFAEDTGLLPAGSFTDLLADARANAASFAPLMQDLWRTMASGGFSPALRRDVRKFNGGLFADATAIPLEREEIGELYEAARHVWTEVEPAIFGTLLEQALDKTERRRLGAHYTPRAYVERLVIATIIAPLQREWEGVVLGTVERERTADPALAIRAVHDFHVKLANTRVLDPACGTGNFLYVALELMKRLEGDVLDVLADLGGQEALALETETVHPRNFLGLELNPRAAAIAELVLWLGYLQWQMRNGGAIADPVLEKLKNITAMDAVLRHDPERPKAGGQGTELPNPRRPDWPDADYIVGNPPFIGGKDVRARLGEAYATALWKAHPKMGKSADFVMYWWDRAAERLTAKGGRLKRFGFVTTNSITQEFSRRVIAARLDGRPPISLVLAIPDHPWTKATRDAAAVRIAMTVAEAGTREGTLMEVIHESGLDTDAPLIGLSEVVGTLNADLTVGTNVTQLPRLKANRYLGHKGYQLNGNGFIITKSEASRLLKSPTLSKRYFIGSDINTRDRQFRVLDFFGMTEEEVRRSEPDAFQHIITKVKPERQTNSVPYRRDNWWLFGQPSTDLREAQSGLSSMIATPRQGKFRIFVKVEGNSIVESTNVVIAVDDSCILGVLSSKAHEVFSLVSGGWMGVGNDPRYFHTATFNPFPFPDATEAQRTIIGDLAEELDATRKTVLAEHPDLTLTGLYNLREKLIAGLAFTPAEQDQRTRGRVDIIAELHDRIDAAVAAAYGWPADLPDAEIVARLVALNAERHAEERAGKVRWLRPDYQLGKAGVTILAPTAAPEQIEATLAPAPVRKPAFPRDAIGQTAAVLADLRGGASLTAADIARRYAQGQKVARSIAATLAALERLGHVASEAETYHLRRAA